VAIGKLEGGCFCRAIRYRITDSPSGSMICHCRTCQRLSAAPTVAWITVARQFLHITLGELSSFRSSPPVQRTFCSQCGTPISYAHNSEPEFIDVTTCSLDDPAAWPPTHHSWLEHNIAWVKFGDGLPAFPQSRNGGAL
jgi:hypothetical protein